MQKIKILTGVQDGESNKSYNANDIVDLGKERNEAAVKRGLAEWVETEKKEEKPKQTATVKGKKIETK